MQKKLKLVGADRHISAANNMELVERGGVIVVDASIAPLLLKETYMDVANNVHPVWQDVTGQVPAEEAPAGDDTAPVARAARSKKQGE